MSKVKAAFGDLKKATQKGKVRKEISEAVDSLSLCLSRLNARSITSVRDLIELVSRLRAPLVPLYQAVPVQALRCSATFLEDICKKKILATNTDQEHKRAWESVCRAILSGVLDFLDVSEKDLDKTKEGVAIAFYSTICSIFLPSSAVASITDISADLRSTAFMLLSDTAASHEKNQDRLRSPKTLGGKRLGTTIYNTKDYLPLESLLTILAHLIPLTKHSESGRLKRTEFIRSVFISPAPSSSGEELVQLMEDVKSTDWDVTAAQVVDILARRDLSFLQPFSLNVINVCGTMFPQPADSDRLYVDRKSLLVNVVEEDAYESLRIPNSSILEVSINPQSTSKSRVVISLDSPAVLAEQPMKVKEGDAMNALFELQRNDVERFEKVLKNRGLGNIIKLTNPTRKSDPKPARISLTQGSARLEFTSGGNLVEEAPTFEDRVKTVENLYKPHDVSDELSVSHDSPVRNTVNAHTKQVNTADTFTKKACHSSEHEAVALNGSTSVAKAPSNGEDSRKTRADRGPPTPGSTPYKDKKGAAPLCRTETQLVRETVFGADEEALSDISDIEDDIILSKMTSKKDGKKDNLQGKTSTTAVLGGSMLGSESANLAFDADEDDADQVSEYLPRKKRTTVNVKKRIIVSDSESEIENSGIITLAGRGDNNTVTSNEAMDIPKPEQTAHSPIQPVDKNELGQSSAAGITLSTTCSEQAPRDGNGSRSNANIFASSTMRRRSGASNSADSKHDIAFSARQKSFAGTNPAAIFKHTSPVITRKEDVDTAASDTKTAVSSRATRRTWRAGELGENAKNESSNARKTVPEHLDGPVDTPKRKRAPKTLKDNLQDHTLESDVDEAPPLKRLRGQVDAADPKRKESAIFKGSSAATTRTKKKYGNRGKKDLPTSSPGLGAVDFDLIPKQPFAPVLVNDSSPLSQRVAEKARKAAAVQSDPKKALKPSTLVAAMKGKDNQTKVVPTEMEDLVKTEKRGRGRPPKAKVAPVQSDAGASLDSDPVSSRTTRSRAMKAKQEAAVVEEKSRSADAQSEVQQEKAGVPAGPLAAETSAHHPSSNAKVKKVKKAPWETTNFLAKSDFQRTSSPQGKLAHQGQITSEEEAPVDDFAQYLNMDAFTDDSDLRVPIPEPVVHSEQDTERKEKATIDLKRHAAVAKPESTLAGALETPESTVAEVLEEPARKPQPREVKRNYNPKIEIEHRQRQDERDARSSDVNMIDLTNDTPIKDTGRKKQKEPEQKPVIFAAQRQRSRADSASVREMDVRTPVRELPALVSESSPSPIVFRSRGLPDFSSPTSRVLNAQKKGKVAFAQSMLRGGEGSDRPETIKRKGLGTGAGMNRSHRDVGATQRRMRDRVVRKFDVEDTSDDEGAVETTVGLQGVIDIINEIHEVVVQKIARKVDGVKTEVRIGRGELLDDAAADLQAVRKQCILHFNNLIDLEAEYARYGRQFNRGWEELLESNQEIDNQLKAVIQKHDREGMSKKMPASLFIGPVPAALQKLRKTG